ncbi:superoxide dismutase [Candidatus Thorarchaeota archaeon]|nr:MAG: superoxide dismutase [Candidatus Thorarchaeota archaeon]
MTFKVPKLNFEQDALEPYMSKETVHYHYDKHTQKYFDTTNELIKGTTYEQYKTLDELLPKLKKGSKLYNQAMQAWNHQFWWEGLAPGHDYTSENAGEVADRILLNWDSFGEFEKEMTEAGTKQFGSGWVWLVAKDKKLEVVATKDADRPDGKLLLVLDLWEHSHYLQYPADRLKYLQATWNIINWKVVNDRYERIDRA